MRIAATILALTWFAFVVYIVRAIARKKLQFVVREDDSAAERAPERTDQPAAAYWLGPDGVYRTYGDDWLQELTTDVNAYWAAHPNEQHRRQTK